MQQIGEKLHSSVVFANKALHSSLRRKHWKSVLNSLLYAADIGANNYNFFFLKPWLVNS